MSTELVVLRAFMNEQRTAADLLACGFAPALMPTQEGREVAQTVLALRAAGTAPTLENLRHALEARRTRHAVPAQLRRYLEALAMMPCCSRLHAVAHLQMLKLDAAMARVDQASQAIGANGGAKGSEEMADAADRASVEAPALSRRKRDAVCHQTG